MHSLNQRLAALSSDQREILTRRMEQAKKSSSPHLSLKSRPREGNHFPLSFVQQRMWFMEQLVPGSPLYNMSGAVRVLGPMKVDALERSFGEIIRRHEILRTTFTIVDGQPVGVVAPVQAVGLQIVDLRGESRVERERKAHQLGYRESQLPFELEKGPLMRFTLVRMAEEESLLLLAMHHMVSDGWSTRVFFQEVGRLYRAFLAGEPSPLPELPFQYADFALWQQEYLQGEVLDSLLAYWKQKLGGKLPVLALPTDYPRPAMQTFPGARHTLTLSPKLTHSLRELCQQQGPTLFMTLLAVFHTLLHRYTGQDDILVGIPIANRTLSGTEVLLGAFFNTLVIRADLTGDPPFLTLLEQIHKASLEAYTHQNLPFQKLVEELDFERDPSRSPIFQVFFNFQNDPTEGIQIPGLSLEDLSAETAKFDLTLNLEANKERITGFIEYNTDLFHPDTIRRLAGHYQTLLEGIIADPHQRLSQLPQTGDLVLSRSNGTAEYPGRSGDQVQSGGHRSEVEMEALQTTRAELESSEQTPESPNELEQTLIEIWKQVLKIDHVGIHQSFFSLGGHSMLAIQVIFRIRAMLHEDIPLSNLFKSPTVAGMARSINLFREKGAAITSGEKPLDLAAEAVLDPAIQPGKALPIQGVSKTQRAFLTGATGFLGAFLLAELLQQPDISSVHCLVRASRIESGRERIRRNLESYGLWNEAFSPRIIPLIGDLARPLLGLATEEFHQLASNIDSIYHSGALVGFLHPYTQFKAVNVLGTQEILRLASTITVKPVHYVSTFHVFSRAEYTNGQIIQEEENPKHGLSFTLGYTQSKWVAEQLVREAGARGLPISIYRPGRIAGHSQTGVFPMKDFVWQSIQVGIRLGIAPELDMNLDMVPVDYVSRAIVSLSRQEGSQGKNFHLVNPHPIHTNELIDWMKTFGYSVKVVPFRQWCTMAREHAERFQDSPARSITPFLSDDHPIDQLPNIQLDTQNTRDGLIGTFIACPPMDAKLLSTYFSYDIQQGYFEAPALAESR